MGSPWLRWLVRYLSPLKLLMLQNLYCWHPQLDNSWYGLIIINPCKHTQNLLRILIHLCSTQASSFFQNLELAAPFSTFIDAQISALHKLAELFKTSAPVHPIITSLTPHVTFPLPRVPNMSPQRETARRHQRVLSPPVIHTIPL